MASDDDRRGGAGTALMPDPHSGSGPAAGPISNILLVSTLDGSIHAVDRAAGVLLWTAGGLGGPLLKGTSPSAYSIALTQEPVFLLEPVFPGSIYAYAPGDVIQKLPLSIRNLVNQSPVRWPDGTLFLGRKVSTFYAINIKTGRVLLEIAQQHSPADDLVQRLQSCSLDAPLHAMLLARTEYQLTAYRLDGPPRRMSFAEFTGIGSPSVLWRRGSDGSIVELEPDILGSRRLSVAQDPHVAYLSSFGGDVYARDRKSGALLWARKLPAPAVAVLRTVPAEAGLGVPSVGLVHQALEPFEADEAPDAQGRYSHPLNMPQRRPHKKRPAACEALGESLVNVGELDGVLFVLPQHTFPRFRDPVVPGRAAPLAQRGAEPRGTALIERPRYEPWLVPPPTCDPASDGWPECLQLGPWMVYQPTPAPVALLDAGPAPLAREQLVANPKLVLTAVLGLLIVLSGLLVVRLWALVRRPRQPAPTPMLVARRPLASSSSSSHGSTASSRTGRPPGFEEITLTAADFFYTVQDLCDGEAPPKSFVVTDQVIGYGSHGTVVFRGQFDGREVAVKRMLLDFYDVAGHEVSLLQQSDHHPNVIRYFCREQTDRFVYIVLELCPASLADVIERPDEPAVLELRPLLADKRRILQEIVLGLEHLHSSKLVHRDIKPANILISPKGRVLLSDFGLSKKLADDQSSFHATVQSGTVGWRAPEAILSDEVARLAETQRMPALAQGIKITKAIDMFAAGCVFFYVLTDGRHPFGTRLQREVNIVQNRTDLSPLDAQPLAQDLVARMVSRDAQQRPTPTQALAHPYFWDPLRRLTFLQDVSDRLEQQDRHTCPTNRALEARRPKIFNGGTAWSTIVDPIVWNDLQGFRKYFGTSLQDLLRAMRNKRHHFHELSPELQAILGHSAEAYLNYFESRFPQLFLQVYLIIENASDYRASHPFKDVYFVDSPPTHPTA